MASRVVNSASILVTRLFQNKERDTSHGLFTNKYLYFRLWLQLRAPAAGFRTGLEATGSRALPQEI